MNIAKPAPIAPLKIVLGQMRAPRIYAANMPVEELCMREFAGYSLSYPLVVRKNPYFLKRNNVIRGVGKLMGNSFYPLFKTLGDEFEAPEGSFSNIFNKMTTI